MKKHILALAAMALCLSAYAKVELGHMMGSHMLLQQNSTVAINGTAAPGAAVTVTPSWSGKQYSGKADSSGAWAIDIDTPAGGFDKYQITVSDGEPVVIDDVLVGEVWLAAGQSNMQMPLKGFDGCNVLGGYDEIAGSRAWADKIRVYNVPMDTSWEPMYSVDASWQVPSPDTAQDFSATAWYYAQRLASVLDVPVGIVNIAYGGTRVESWLPREILETYPDVSLKKEDVEGMVQYLRPMLMYNAMFLPAKDYNYAGIIWYQGCSNVGSHDTYPQRLATMVEHWRSLIGEGDIPFYEVEIAPYDYGSNSPNESGALLREAQWKSTELIPNSGIISTNNLAAPYERHNIHPENKADVGKRLADYALNKHYGRTQFLADSPRYKSHRVQDGAVWVAIDSPSHGICRNFMIEGFEVAGADKVFHKADNAWLNWQTNEIVVSSQEVPEPVAVRYCFRDFMPGTLYAGNYLPLVPFRSDNW